MHIDADDIIANATENLYEDAMDDISEEKCKELQNMLDKWCDTCGVRETYVKSNKYKVKIPWKTINILFTFIISTVNIYTVYYNY